MTITFILVQPTTPENIGAAARALKTMGFSDLRLINPCDHLSEQARWLAHNSADILENAAVFTDLKNAVKDIDFLIGTSSKPRFLKQGNYSIRNLSQLIKNKGSAIQSIGIIFGTENRGLGNEHIALCDILSHIPMKQAQPSLNLAQSVMIYAYELSALYQRKSTQKPRAASEAGYYVLKKNMTELLSSLNLHSHTSLKNRIMERLAALSEKDTHLVQSILTALKKQNSDD